MSHVSKLLLLSCLAGAFACTVPTIAELEAERPGTYYECNSDHPCPPGLVCIVERCIPRSELECEPGTRVACGSGSDRGVCSAGTKLCNALGIFEPCEDVVTPVFEKCDGQDNDCDGESDNWANPLELTLKHDGSSSAAAIAVRRMPDGSQDTLLTLTAETGRLVTRTLTADGTWTLGKEFSHPFMSFKLPTLAAQGDTVAVAWVGVQAPEGTGPSLYRVYLATVNGAGSLTNKDAIEIPYDASAGSGSTIAPDLLKLAVNKTHILVLVKTPEESFVVTVARNLDEGSRKGPTRLGTVFSDLWFQASPDGSGDGFVVAYQDMFTDTNGSVAYYNQTATVSTAGVLGRPMAIKHSLSTPPHSPFILPLPDSASEYFVYYVENGFETGSPAKSRVSSTKCGPVAPCESSMSFVTFEKEVQRMQLAAQPGAVEPEVALFRWQESRTAPPSLTAITFTDKGDRLLELRPRGQLVLSESLVLMPDSTRYLLYNQPPAVPSVVSSLAVGFEVTEARIQPFCGL
ncbi:hypothetical protein BO221_38185 [Archangium sp. Cb G35]|uniref:hypothetical protein n=1 Tax=Archangium sp. Cb G35 TaxID=1920190 RepID=UPI000936C023|nr:hypothetical protein [Archangium sp. Cb G35]OJT19306.1 hypothetical protein BO221_38185 [Archangium sp. Cb G35]